MKRELQFFHTIVEAREYLAEIREVSFRADSLGYYVLSYHDMGKDRLLIWNKNLLLNPEKDRFQQSFSYNGMVYLPFKGKPVEEEFLNVMEEFEFWKLIKSKGQTWLFVPYNRTLYYFDEEEANSEFYYLPPRYTSWSFKAQILLSLFSAGKTFTRKNLERYQLELDSLLEEGL